MGTAVVALQVGQDAPGLHYVLQRCMETVGLGIQDAVGQPRKMADKGSKACFRQIVRLKNTAKVGSDSLQ